MMNEYVEWTNLTLQITRILDAKDLWCIPGIAADTPQPVEIILVEDLEKANKETPDLSIHQK